VVDEPQSLLQFNAHKAGERGSRLGELRQSGCPEQERECVRV
jgi:hypothetical protein